MNFEGSLSPENPKITDSINENPKHINFCMHRKIIYGNSWYVWYNNIWYNQQNLRKYAFPKSANINEASYGN